MVLFNYSTKELTAKVVYYGPGLCGKTTNLQWIHEKLPIKNKGKMLSLATETDRTLFFDFLPIEIGTIRGMKTRIQLYTVPGQVFYNATRRMVLKGADAVVFVCDSQEPTFEGNLESFENLRQNLIANEIDPDESPVVLQYNKRDLPNALPIEILNERLNKRGYPWHEAVAVKGIGVEETLKTVTKLVFKYLSARYGEGGVQQGRPASRPSVASPPSASGGGPASHPAASGAGFAAPPSASGAGFAPPPPAAAPLPVSAPTVPLQAVSPPPPARVEPAPAPPRSPAPPPARPVEDSRSPLRDLPPLDLELDDDAFEPPPRHAPVPMPPMAELPTRPPVPPTPPPPSLLKPESTLVTRRDEADELRRRIATPGLMDADEGLELEELELEPEPEDVRRLPLNSLPPLPPSPREVPQARTPPRTPPPLPQPEPEPRPPTPPPMLRPPLPAPPPESAFERAEAVFDDLGVPFEEEEEPAQEPGPGPAASGSGSGRGAPELPALRTSPAASPREPVPAAVEVELEHDLDGAETEVEVPIEVEIAPGTTRLALRLKLSLTFKQR